MGIGFGRTNLVDGIRILRHIKDDGRGSPLHRPLCLQTHNEATFRYFISQSRENSALCFPEQKNKFLPLEGVICLKVSVPGTNKGQSTCKQVNVCVHMWRAVPFL